MGRFPSLWAAVPGPRTLTAGAQGSVGPATTAPGPPARLAEQEEPWLPLQSSLGCSSALLFLFLALAQTPAEFQPGVRKLQGDPSVSLPMAGVTLGGFKVPSVLAHGRGGTEWL